VENKIEYNKTDFLLSVVLPTYNEAENIIELIENILKFSSINTEIIVVDDNSPDKTWELVDNLKKENVRCIRRTTERGLASALARGIKESKGDYILWMDADLCMPPEKIPEFIDTIKTNAVVIGSRYVKGAKDNRALIRVITSRMINFFANFVLNFKIKDYDSGFIMVKKEVFDNISLNTSGYGEYCVKFLYDCTKKHFKIKEVPYYFTDRKKGQSKTTEHFYSLFTHGWKYGMAILKIRFGFKN